MTWQEYAAKWSVTCVKWSTNETRRVVIFTAFEPDKALWQRQTTANLARQDNTPAQGRITAEMGYGLDVPYSYGILTPYGSVELVGGGSRTLRLGWRFELGQRLSLSLAGERRETALARPEHGLMLPHHPAVVGDWGKRGGSPALSMKLTV